MDDDRPTDGAGRRRSLLLLVLAGLAVVGAGALPRSTRSVLLDVLYVVGPCVLVVAALRAAAVSEGPVRRGWRLLAGSGVAWAVAGLFYVVLDSVIMESAVDLLFLAALLLLAAALACFTGTVPPGRRLRAALDDLLVGLSLFVVLWALLLHGLADWAADHRVHPVYVVAYPAMDIVLCVLALAAIGRGRLGLRTSGLLAAGVVFYGLADANVAYETVRSTYEGGAVPDLLWVAGYLTLAAAAFGAAREGHLGPQPRRTPTLVENALPYVPAVVAAFVLVAERRTLVDDLSLAVTGLAMFLLACTRQVLLLQENARLAAELGQAVVDRTAELRDREAELDFKTYHDTLTGLGNRLLFRERVGRALASARDRGTSVAVLFVDLDDFKTVNDGLGHSAGDALLRVVAQRIVAQVRPFDTVARLGGDEFAVLVDLVGVAEDAGKVTERILGAIREPVSIDGQDVQVSASIGIAVGHGETTLDDLLSHADVAMYRAKGSGKAGFALFEADMQVQVLQRLQVKADLERALDAGEIEPFYQPIVDLATGRIVAVEALARWRHPERGLVPPGEFIPLAEETGQIVAIGRQILHRACHQLAAWRDTIADVDDLSVSVNLAARQLQDPDLVDQVAADLTASGLPPTCLILEVTETMIMADIDAAVARLRRLQGFGVRVALDDFGTGFSSLSYLQQLPIDELKIDKSFVDLLATDAARDAQWAEAVVALGRILDLTVIAEGIESDHQLKSLRDLRCNRGQGYLFARPVPPEELAALLRDRTNAAPAARAVSFAGSRPAPAPAPALVAERIPTVAPEPIARS